jgi:hypothetical protein
MAALAMAENVDPDADGSQYAWAENVGWINAEPQGDGGSGVDVTDLALTGWMWGENIGWISLSCQNTSSCGTVDYGVGNDGDGKLTGFAWAENAGWISFSCETTSSCGTAAYGVTIDPFTGEFSGEAWAENLGWIRFASSGANPFRMKTAWTCTPPVGSPSLTMSKTMGETVLSWPGSSFASLDVVRGDLSSLRSSAGDFSLSTDACIVDDLLDPSVIVPDTPAVGEGVWILARPANCGAGTYDSSGAAQTAPRDAGIAAAASPCP